jgi:hypothetical protein
MITAKNENGRILIDFSSTMFFEEIMKAPSETRKELIEHIKLQDNEWLFKFCIKHFGSKIFFIEN